MSGTSDAFVMVSGCLACMQVAQHPLEVVCNRASTAVGEQESSREVLVQEQERFSLTVRRVLKVRRLLK